MELSLDWNESECAAATLSPRAMPLCPRGCHGASGPAHGHQSGARIWRVVAVAVTAVAVRWDRVVARIPVHPWPAFTTAFAEIWLQAVLGFVIPASCSCILLAQVRVW